MREDSSLTIPEWTSGPSQDKITYPRKRKQRRQRIWGKYKNPTNP